MATQVKTKKKKKKAVAPLPEAVKAQDPKKRRRRASNPLFERRPRDFSIGQDVQPPRDLSRFVRWPKVVRVQRHLAVLRRRLKVPPPVHQFSQTLDSHGAATLLRLLEKYRPESKTARRRRLREEAAARVAGTAPAPEKLGVPRRRALHEGVRSVTRLVESRRALLVALAHDVDPVELVLALPALCRKMGVPYCVVKGKARLGLLVGRKTCAAVALARVDPADRATLAKTQEVLRNNFNDRHDELRRHWGGGVLGAKSLARARALENKDTQ